jgi:CRP/FNR family transcriptional regulator, cyclic AMP receptor protein
VRDQALQALISSAWKDSVFFFASDGNQVLQKADKAPPHLFVLSSDAAKPNGIEIYDRIKDTKPFKKSAFIVLLEEGVKIVMNDDSATGRAHFIPLLDREAELRTALAKVQNFLSESNNEGAGYKSRFVKKGDSLISFGEQAEFVYILVRGRLVASIKNDSGEVKVLGYIEPGEFVGEMSYINNEARAADVNAELDSELLEINIQSMDTVLYQKPAWAKAMIKTLSRRLKGANTKPRS